MINKYSEAVLQISRNKTLHSAIAERTLTSEECDELIECVTGINPEVERLTIENNELRSIILQVINRLENVVPLYDPREVHDESDYLDTILGRVKGTLEYIKSQMQYNTEISVLEIKPILNNQTPEEKSFYTNVKKLFK